MLQLFIIDEDGNVKINRIELMQMFPFNVILKRKRTCPTDKTGMKKVVATWELIFIRHVASSLLDENNVYAALSEREKTTKLKADFGLPMGINKNWVPDEKVKLAIKKYVEIQQEYVPSAAMLNSLEASMMINSNAIRTTNKAITEIMEMVEVTREKLEADNTNRDMEEIAKSFNVLDELSTKLFAALKRNNDIAKSVPDVLKTIKLLRTEVKKELGKARELRGKRKKGNREDP